MALRRCVGVSVTITCAVLWCRTDTSDLDMSFSLAIPSLAEQVILQALLMRGGGVMPRRWMDERHVLIAIRFAVLVRKREQMSGRVLVWVVQQAILIMNEMQHNYSITMWRIADRAALQLLRAAYDGQCMVDADGVVIQSSEEFDGVFRTSMLGTTISKFIVDTERDRFRGFVSSSRRMLAAYAVTSEDTLERASRCFALSRDEDGSEFHCEFNTVPLRGRQLIAVRIHGEKIPVVQAPVVSTVPSTLCSDEVPVTRPFDRDAPLVDTGSDAEMTLLSSFGLSAASTVDAATQTSLRPPRPPGDKARPSDETLQAHSSTPSKRRRVRVMLNSSKLALPQFAETPSTTSVMVLWIALHHLNIRGSGCCTLHVGLARLASAMKELQSRACSPVFSPYRAWQCVDCLSMNNNEEDDDNDSEKCSDDGGSSNPRAIRVCAVCEGVDARRPRSNVGSTLSEDV